MVQGIRSRERLIDVCLWMAAAALLAADLWLSLGPPPEEVARVVSDKLLHAGAWAATASAFLLAAVWRPGRARGPYPAAAPLIVVVGCILAAGIEPAQGLVGRETEVLDAVAGIAGVLGASAAWWGLRAVGSPAGS